MLRTVCDVDLPVNEASMPFQIARPKRAMTVDCQLAGFPHLAPNPSLGRTTGEG